MPRPSELPSSPGPAAALLLSLIRDGTATLVKAISERIRLIQQVALLWLARWYKRLTPTLVSPLWHWAHTAGISMLQSRVADVCWRLVHSWLANLKALQKRLNSTPTKSQQLTPETFGITESHSRCDKLTPRDNELQDSVGPSGMACPIDISGNNSSPHGSPDSLRRSPVTTPQRREPLAGSWSSVSVIDLSALCTMWTKPPWCCIVVSCNLKQSNTHASNQVLLDSMQLQVLS